jgi:hypothetical protein
VGVALDDAAFKVEFDRFMLGLLCESPNDREATD